MSTTPKDPPPIAKYDAPPAPSSPHARGPTPPPQHLPELLEFAKDTQDHLLRLQSDFLTDSTRTEQRLLVVVAFLLLFVSLGSIAVGSDVKIPVGSLIFTSKAPETFTLLGALVCLYLEVTVAIRVYTDRAADSIARDMATLALATKMPLFFGPPLPFNQTKRGRHWLFERGRHEDSGLPPDLQSEFDSERTEYESKLVAYQSKREWVDARMGKLNNHRLKPVG